mmetsp:Transcript_3772/g.8311  ORF Transcript_3772/g.8311 Transcript_3772/m.8311 type:complete len:200 (-) Transcript_3772:855-1454(-)
MRVCKKQPTLAHPFFEQQEKRDVSVHQPLTRLHGLRVICVIRKEQWSNRIVFQRPFFNLTESGFTKQGRAPVNATCSAHVFARLRFEAARVPKLFERWLKFFVMISLKLLQAYHIRVIRHKLTKHTPRAERPRKRPVWQHKRVALRVVGVNFREHVERDCAHATGRIGLSGTARNEKFSSRRWWVRKRQHNITLNKYPP